MKNLVIFTLFVFAVSIVTLQSCKKNRAYPVYGCTYEGSLNYNPEATIDDGSCVLPEGSGGLVPGCMDPDAENYDPNATIDDGTCIIYGCTNPNSENYNPKATDDDGSCIDQREKFVGDYTVTSDCSFPFFPVGDQSMYYDTLTEDTLWIGPFIPLGGDAYSIIDGEKVTLPEQTQGLATFSGSGSINSAHTIVTIDIDWDMGFLGSGSCTETYTRN